MRYHVGGCEVTWGSRPLPEPMESATDKRKRERMEKMTQVRHRDAMKTWPTSCPKCFAAVGEKCMTESGGRAGLRHAKRAMAVRDFKKGNA